MNACFLLNGHHHWIKQSDFVLRIKSSPKTGALQLVEPHMADYYSEPSDQNWKLLPESTLFITCCFSPTVKIKWCPVCRRNFWVHLSACFDSLVQNTNTFITLNLFAFLWLGNTVVNISHMKKEILYKGFMWHQSSVQTTRSPLWGLGFAVKTWRQLFPESLSQTNRHRTMKPIHSFQVLYQHKSHLYICNA